MKELKDLTFADDFMFGKVMENKKICKELLEILLDIKIEKIDFPQIQKELRASYKSKSIRLDVFASDPKRNFDIELQMFNHAALPQRMRYYQSLMDIDALLKGRKYTELKENYVIFICMFDPFGEDLPEYFFENTCRQKTNIKLNDKSYKVCYNVNAFAKAGNVKVKAFLEYLKTQNAKDDFTQKLDGIVKRMKENNAVQREFMMRNIFVDDWFDRGYDKGIAVGVEQGRQEGVSQGAHNKAIETARNFLALGVNTPEQIAQATGLSLTEVQQMANEVHAMAQHVNTPPPAQTRAGFR